ncbi:hypothetical protein AGMMS50262_23560 [Bacteroidia bacterium]|nr:hypothetical protein AGMMS50262_23560 [Bacteroidia bacterium]
MNMPRPADSYNYPVYLGTEEWARLQTYDERLAACRVPEYILKEMSTQAVIQALLESPLFPGLFLSYSSSIYRIGVDRILSEKINPYNELKTRSDAGKCLLGRVLLFDYATQDWPMLCISNMEICFAQDIFLNQLSETETKTAISITLHHDSIEYDTKSSDRISSWILIFNILKSVQYSPFMEYLNQYEDLEYFEDGIELAFKDIRFEGDGRYPYVVSTVYEHAKEYIKKTNTGIPKVSL